MPSKRILVSFVTLFMLLSVAGFAAEPAKQKPAAKAAAGDGPQLTLVEPLKDYGTIPKGEKIHWDFVVKNSGKSDLQILSAQPTCGCTVANFDKVIKPGQSGKVSAVVDTAAFSGAISKAITLQTNDPNTPAAQLTINAIVKPYVEAYPAGYVRYSVLQGDTSVQSVTLYTEEDEPFEITGVEVPGEWVKVDYNRIGSPEERIKAGKANQNQYKVDITYGGPTTKLGPIAEKVRIKTSSKHQPEYVLSLSGVVRPTYSVNPSVLNFGEVAPADPAASRTVTVKSNDANAPQLFQVTKVESTLPSVSAEVKAGDKPGEYRVTAAIAKDAAAGAIDGTIRIFTSDKLKPMVELPVKGAVKTAAAAEVKPATK